MNNINEIFKPENKSIKQMFGDSDAFYQMPIYQRPYSWDKERVEQLWYDVVEAFKNNSNDSSSDQSYFLGSVVVVKKSDGFEVVDGQQRLTTLTILFCVLRDIHIELKQKNIVSNSIKDLVEGKERLKLTTHLNNQALFDESILKGIDFEEIKNKKKLLNNRFLQTASYFYELIKSSSHEGEENYISNFDNFINYLFNQITMIRVVCFDENFAIKLFTVLNDRGLDLTSADIIKAHLLQKLDENKRLSFIEVWKEIESICKMSGESLQSIFNLYLYYSKNENPKRALQDELKACFKGEDPQTKILEVKLFAENILELSNEEDKNYFLLKYLGHSVYWKSILVTAKQENYSHYNELKSLLTKYYYQSWIANGTANRIKQTSFKIIKQIKDGSSIDQIKLLITENLKRHPNYLDSLNTEHAYSTKWHKPLLLAVEYYQQDDRDFISISRNLHTEHILPKEWNNKDLNWKNFFTKETAQPLLNSLGNLTLLSGTKNIKASNRNFSAKREIYKGNDGKGLDGKTSFEITKKVIDDNNTEWTPKEINERYNWLFSEIKRIFDIT